MQATFLPQRPIAAPGKTLRDQLTYPAASHVSSDHLADLLSTVQLSHLLSRVEHEWDREHHWQGLLCIDVNFCCSMERASSYSCLAVLCCLGRSSIDSPMRVTVLPLQRSFQRVSCKDWPLLDYFFSVRSWLCLTSHSVR